MEERGNRTLNRLVRRLIGDKAIGWIEFFWFPERRRTEWGPFNGQAIRAKIFRDLVDAVGPTAVVETGTYRGVTTEYMWKTARVPVFTLESNERSYGYSKARLALKRGVHLAFGDSRVFLPRVTEKQGLRDKTVLFYLDAHWGEQLPLFEEVDIVFRLCERPVVLIDDFQVPDDPGYGYDDYGEAKTLNLGYIAPLIQRYELAVYFPRTPASQESGERRGSVVLASHPEIRGALDAVPSLRRWKQD